MIKLYDVTIKLNTELYIDDEEVENGIVHELVYEVIEKKHGDIVGVWYEEMEDTRLIEEQERLYDLGKGN